MTMLSVNINKLATLRNARSKNMPHVLYMTLEIIKYGAQGITVHPRPDGRHILKQDIYDLADNITVDFNIEGYPDKNFLNLIKVIKPTQCTLVPDPPHVLTSNAGWEVSANCSFLQMVVDKLHSYGSRVSIFIDPLQFTQEDMMALINTSTDRVELYTEAYADNYGLQDMYNILNVYKNLAVDLNQCGIAINAGHDLNLHNLQYLIQEIPMITEVSIGHALICDALTFGMRETVAKYLDCLRSE